MDENEIYIVDAEQAIRSDPDSLKYVLTKDSEESWAYNSQVYALGIYDRMKLRQDHSGCSMSFCLRAAEKRIKEASTM